MGEVDVKSIENACKQKLSQSDNIIDHAAFLCSGLQDEIKVPAWHPFKVVMVDGKEMVLFTVATVQFDFYSIL